MTMFVTHPSVRIRGTENNYGPVQCLDPNCSNKPPHMHCPFCQRTEAYHDPVILKAHYRVKHVDKGIDFAGLKILRCCDHCDIVGAIKGEKKFKGAHWHCYKCKNGFNRRDEAVKHYKTHFRNPQTTFQIQITQEVNHPIHYYETHEEMQLHTISHDGISTTIHPVLTEAIMSTVSSNQCLNNENDSSLANGHASDGDHFHVSVAANETIGGSDGQAAIMIIHEEQIDSSGSCQAVLSPINTNGDTLERLQFDQKIAELQQEYKQKEMYHSQKERQLQTEIQQLKMQLQFQAQEITSLKKREEELLQQLRVPLDSKLQSLLTSLQVQHSELLQQQLLQVRREAFAASELDADHQAHTLRVTPKSSPPLITSSPNHQTVVALVMDPATANLVPLGQQVFSHTLNTSVSLASTTCTVELSPEEVMGEEMRPVEECRSPSDSLVIVDVSAEDVKKREADDAEMTSNDTKRKK